MMQMQMNFAALYNITTHIPLSLIQHAASRGFLATARLLVTK